MNQLWNSQVRVSDRLAEVAREAELARRARGGSRPAGRIATGLAAALRDAADVLDSASARSSLQIQEN